MTMVGHALGEYPSADAAWRAALRVLYENGTWIPSVTDRTSVGSKFGKRLRDFKEVSAVSFSINNPMDRIVSSKARAIDSAFLFANVVWVLSGSRELKMIAPYNPKGLCFSDDGLTLASAFGPKIFSGASTPFDRIANLLKRDPSTRRAVIDLFETSALTQGSKDVSCALAVQYLIRSHRLDCVVYMRSQSAAMVLPYDLFLFTMLHEAMARQIGRELGRYTHISGSFHYYDDEERVVQEVLNESPPAEANPMPAMQKFSPQLRRSIVEAEIPVRADAVRRDCSQFANIDEKLRRAELDKYWRDAFTSFLCSKTRTNAGA